MLNEVIGVRIRSILFQSLNKTDKLLMMNVNGTNVKIKKGMDDGCRKATTNRQQNKSAFL